MSKLSEFLTNIANAIRNLKGTSEPINAQNFATEINDMKEALDDTTATPEDIVLGKTAYVKGQKVEGTFAKPTTLKALLDYTKSCHYMFYNNKNITDLTGYIAYEDTSKVTSMARMFASCRSLETIPQLDISKVTDTVYTFDNCTKLTNLTLLNIKINLQVGSGSSYGHLLTLESLLGLCQECVNVNASRKLTVGTANMNKLANVYVKLTGEPEEDETLPKIPMVQCESTDEGAMTITQYMAEKNWSLA